MRHSGAECDQWPVYVGPKAERRFGPFFAVSAEGQWSEHYRDQVPILVPNPGSPSVTCWLAD